MTITANTRIQGTNPATGRLKYATGTGEVVEYRETGHHGTVAVVRWTNGVETTHCRDLDNSNVSGLEFPAKLHEQPMADSPAAVAQAEEAEQGWADYHMLDARNTAGLTSADWATQTDDAANAVDPEFAAEVDALVARDLRDDMPTGLVERVQVAAGIANRESTEGHDIGGNVAKPELHPYYQRQFAAELPVTTTNVGASRVAVVVQSGSRLLWGTLISVINRRTRYSSPLLVTVELESGVRQLVAADDILAA